MELYNSQSSRNIQEIKRIVKKLKENRDNHPKRMRAYILSCFLGFFCFGGLPVLADILPGSLVSLDCKDMPKAYQVRFLDFVPGGLKVQIEDGRTQVIVNGQCAITEALPPAKEGTSIVKEEIKEEVFESNTVTQ